MAVHKITGAKVAIKQIVTKDYNRLSCENGISEAAAMRLCSKSKQTVSLVEDFTVGKHTYIVTKFIKTGDLLAYLESMDVNRVPEHFARSLFKQIVQAVATCHSQGVVHRDIKHLNVLISEKGGHIKPKLTDFGMAARLKEDEMINKMAGTISFMAPEIVCEEPSDFKADVWSLGVMLYALISSNVPFQGCDRDDTAGKIVNDEVSFADAVWSPVSSSCKDLIRQMLTKDQTTRLTASDVLEHPWFGETR